jgi:hypothetical protein
VVDLTDFPGSVWPNILDLLGKNKKILLVGNKVKLRKVFIKIAQTLILRSFISVIKIKPMILFSLISK